MNYEIRWDEQMKDMDSEDRYHDYIKNNKIYPRGLFNVSSNPIFNTLSWARRVTTVRHIILTNGDVKKHTIFYDPNNNVVFFETTKGVRHKCDMERKYIQAYLFWTELSSVLLSKVWSQSETRLEQAFPVISWIVKLTNTWNCHYHCNLSSWVRNTDYTLIVILALIFKGIDKYHMNALKIEIKYSYSYIYERFWGWSCGTD